jgi:hypothetical protein
MIFTEHALERMRQRNISKAQVKDVYRNYDVVIPGYDCCRNYFKRFLGEQRIIRVTVAEAEKGPVVVTVAEDSL